MVSRGRANAFRFRLCSGRHGSSPHLKVAYSVLLAAALMPQQGAVALGNDLSAPTIERLLARLDAEDLAERVAAERDLLEMGPDVLPHLPPPDRMNTPAARDALRRIREALERTQAERSVLPSRVTLSGERSLGEILDHVQSQTGNAVRTTLLPPEARNGIVPCDWQRATFWECLELIDRQPDVAVRFDPADGLLEVVPETAIDERTLRMAAFGAFVVTVRSATLRPDFTDRSRNLIRVQYDVAAEPRLRPLFVRVHDADFRLTINDAETKAPEAHQITAAPLNANARRERPADQPGPVPLSTDFVVPRSWSVDAVNMAGRIEIELAAGQEEIVFRELGAAERVVRRRGGVKVTLDRARFAADGEGSAGTVRVDLRVAYDQGGPAFESHRTWVYHNDAFLRSADGTRVWSPAGFDTVAESEGAVKLSYRFDEVAEQANSLEFVYAAPTLILSVPLPIELADISVERSPEQPP